MSENNFDDMDENEEEHEEEEQSFAELLESYDSGIGEDLQVGDKVTGGIISIGHDTVFVDTGTKVDGAVEKQELLNEEGEFPYKSGDTLELFVVAVDEHEIKLSKAISGIGGITMLREAYEGRIPIEGKVTAECKGGFNVEIMKRRAFCPISQMDVKFIEKPDEYVGQTFNFIVIQFEERTKNIVVSRRKILEVELKKAADEFFKDVKIDDVMDATITRVEVYGAFASLIPGVEGMIHISELSWSRALKAKDIVKPGEHVRVKILTIGEDEKTGKMRISLSTKQITQDPWDSFEDRFAIGDKIKGKVTKCAPFGAFVELESGIEGLVHISEMSYVKRIVNPEDVVKPGETIDILIKEVDLEGRKISLSIRDAEGDPWIGIEEKYGIGQSVNGILEKKMQFGYFVQLEPGITGLLPKNNIIKSEDPAAIEKIKEGENIFVKVSEINSRERKITLNPDDLQNETEWKKFKDEDSSDNFGSLGEKLQQALKGKK